MTYFAPERDIFRNFAAAKAAFAQFAYISIIRNS
jgi:hypothetical protein